MALKLELVSDFACPWCRVGERHLEVALKDSGVAVEVGWVPFRLNPDLPGTGVPRRAYLEGKFGAHVEDAHAPLEAAAKAGGWAFSFDLMEVEPNTLDAHRLMIWGPAQAMATDLARRLFDAHWEGGRDLGDRATLAAIAGEAGLSAQKAGAYLESDEGTQEVKASQLALARAGIHAVPSFILEGRFLIQGAVPVEVLVDFLQRGAEGRLY
ncbi:MAG: DsbA family oxidoreductase [Acidobacteria bacterium]|nr:DsbA family oxidoreductase [Acidobacteriota bacterium]